MEHFYQNIEGWFDFQDIYSNQVKMATEGSHFVEIGAWLGRSTSFMGVEILNSNKNIKFDVVDTWKGSDNELETSHALATKTDIFQLFLNNTLPVKDKINTLRMDSVSASELYPNNSLDFIFIDANHEYEFVINDIRSWYPKLKRGGYIGGHDYHHPPVKKAVNDFFGKVAVSISSWLYQKT